MKSTHKTIICGQCGTKEDNVLVTDAVIYFPNRMIYVKHKALPYQCSGCGLAFDMVLFGEESCNSITNIELQKHPNIIENNRLYNLKKEKKCQK